MTNSFSHDNELSRQRMRQVSEQLKEDDLAVRGKYGWTVSMTFAHLGFWDKYYFTLLTRWEESGFQETSADAEAINAALRPLIEAIEGSTAMNLALAAADAVDGKIAALPFELRQSISANGHDRLLRRSIHRNEHLDDIEAAVQER